jgi:hypothetical protein
MDETMNDKIFQAFIAAQRQFGPALKSSTNPHFRSRYADLSACVEAVIDALMKAKPATAKGTYMQKINLSATMGPGVKVDVTPFRL